MGRFASQDMRPLDLFCSDGFLLEVKHRSESERVSALVEMQIQCDPPKIADPKHKQKEIQTCGSLDLQYWACWDQPSNKEPIGCNLNKH